MPSYWRIFAEEVPADLGIELTHEQIDKLTAALEGAHENYGLASGQEVADRNWRAAEDRALRQKGAEAALAYIEERMERIEAGPNFFAAMGYDQKLAMHELFAARKFLRTTLEGG